MKKLLTLLAFIPLVAFAWQPTKPITVIFPNGPGAGNEISFFFVADIVSNKTGVTFKREHRAGADGNIAMNCHGRITPYKFDTNYESRMWIGMQSMYKEMQEDSYIDFQNHKIRDYTAGTLTTWFALFNYNYMDTNQKTLIHCLAGFGRTGSILLLIFMYNNYNNHSEKHRELSEPFLGYTNGLDLFVELSVSFLDAIELDTSPENGKVNEDIRIFDISEIVKEVFDISNYSHANMFITRMNYIRICLGLSFGIKDIFLYKLWSSDTNSSITLDTIFSSEGREMDKIQLSEIETISSQVDNPYGITV